MPKRLAAPAIALVAVLPLAVLAAGCAGAGAAPSPSPTPTPQASPKATPTPIAVPVISSQDAAARVIATNAIFAGAVRRDPQMIGGSRWWEAQALAGGGWLITLTVGWGDCPAGCIERHVWTFEVAPNGSVSLEGESGDPVPDDLPA